MNAGPLPFGASPMPHGPDLEKALLSCCIQDPQLTAGILGMDSAAFYIPANRAVFEAIKQISVEFPIYDFVTLADKLESMGMMDHVGGIAAVRDIYSIVPTVVNYMDYHAKVMDYYKRRKIIEVCMVATGDSYETEKTTLEVLGEVESKVLSIGEDDSRKKAQPIREITDDAIKVIEGIWRRDPVAMGISTGYTGLDKLIGGLRPGTVFVLAARPSIGKTAFAMDIIRNAACFGYPAAYFNLEMSNVDLTTRLMYSQAGISALAIRERSVAWEAVTAQLAEAKKAIDRMPIILDEQGGKWEDIRHRIRVMVYKHGIKLVALDYLQLMFLSGLKRHQTRENEVAFMSANIKALARELNIPIIVLAQLNREAEGKLPQIKDLRESGAIENDADQVALLHRERETEDRKTAELVFQHLPIPTLLKMCKNRNGPTGSANLEWYRELTTFRDAPRISDAEVASLRGD